MNKIILCDACQSIGNEENYCDRCAFYIEEYCNNCTQRSEELCSICRDARSFLENDDKRQASKERTDRNHIIHISVEYAEGTQMLADMKSTPLDELLITNNREKILAAFNSLTEIQKRRFIAHSIDGKTYREIADVENVHFTTVKESIDGAKCKLGKKLKIFLNNTPTNQ